MDGSAESLPPAGTERGSDEDLARGYAERGDRAALEELIVRYSPRLRRLLFTMLGGNLDVIEDAEQEVFVALVKRIGRFRGDSRFSTFFYSLARNRVLDLMRAAARSARHAGAQVDDSYESGRPGPQEELLSAEQARAVRKALATLRPDDRVLLYLKDVESEPVERLAGVFSMPQGTVKSRLSRARAKLAVTLKEYGYEP